MTQLLSPKGTKQLGLAVVTWSRTVDVLIQYWMSDTLHTSTAWLYLVLCMQEKPCVAIKQAMKNFWLPQNLATKQAPKGDGKCRQPITWNPVLEGEEMGRTDSGDRASTRAGQERAESRMGSLWDVSPKWTPHATLGLEIPYFFIAQIFLCPQSFYRITFCWQ